MTRQTPRALLSLSFSRSVKTASLDASTTYAFPAALARFRTPTPRPRQRFAPVSRWRATQRGPRWQARRRATPRCAQWLSRERRQVRRHRLVLERRSEQSLRRRPTPRAWPSELPADEDPQPNPTQCGMQWPRRCQRGLVTSVIDATASEIGPRRRVGGLSQRENLARRRLGSAPRRPARRSRSARHPGGHRDQTAHTAAHDAPLSAARRGLCPFSPILTKAWAWPSAAPAQARTDPGTEWVTVGAEACWVLRASAD